MDTRIRLVGLGLGLATVAALAAGCGGSSSPAAPAATQNAMTAYTTCLANNGVVLPSAGARPGGNPSARPSGGPGTGGAGGGGTGGGGFGGSGFGNQKPAGVDQATWDKAQQACASLRPTAGARAGAGNG